MTYITNDSYVADYGSHHAKTFIGLHTSQCIARCFKQPPKSKIYNLNQTRSHLDSDTIRKGRILSTIPTNPHCTNVDGNPSPQIDHTLYRQANSNHQAALRTHRLTPQDFAHSRDTCKEGAQSQTTHVISPPGHYTLKEIPVAAFGRTHAGIECEARAESKRTCRDGGADSRCRTRGRGHHSREASPGHRSGGAVCLAATSDGWRRRLRGRRWDARAMLRTSASEVSETSESLGSCSGGEETGRAYAGAGGRG